MGDGMNEANQSDDFYIPTNFFGVPLQPETKRLYTQVDDFLKTAYTWMDVFLTDECME